MSAFYGSALRHPAQFWTHPEMNQRAALATALLENKLGREPSQRIIKVRVAIISHHRTLPCQQVASVFVFDDGLVLSQTWVFSPLLRRVMFGFSEELTIKEDSIEVRTRSGIPPCCVCGREAWADSDEYYTLLRDINFVEIGSELNPFLHFAALFCLSISFGVFLLSYLGPLWEDDGWVESALCWLKDCHSSEDFKESHITEVKWFTAIAGVLGYVVMEWLAGTKKRGFIVINVPLGGTLRGTSSKYMGTTPFYIRLKTNHVDTDPGRYKHLVRLIRAAVTASRGRSNRVKRSIAMFRQAGRAVQAVNQLGTIVEEMREQLKRNPVEANQSKKARRKLAKQHKQLRMSHQRMGSTREIKAESRASFRAVAKSVRNTFSRMPATELTASAKIFAEIDKGAAATSNCAHSCRSELED